MTKQGKEKTARGTILKIGTHKGENKKVGLLAFT
jgi:hypothetical protein